MRYGSTTGKETMSKVPGLKLAHKAVMSLVGGKEYGDEDLPGLLEAAELLSTEIWAWEETERVSKAAKQQVEEEHEG